MRTRAFSCERPVIYINIYIKQTTNDIDRLSRLPPLSSIKHRQTVIPLIEIIKRNTRVGYHAAKIDVPIWSATGQERDVWATISLSWDEMGGAENGVVYIVLLI